MLNILDIINNGSVKNEYNRENTKYTKTYKSKVKNDILELDTNVNRLSFYKANQNNVQSLLDAINFSDGTVSANTDGRGYFEFGSDGVGQIIPQSAISSINVNLLEKLYAVDNKITLKSKSYYSYTGTDGNSYACAFNGTNISRAFSEAIINDDMNNVSSECRGNSVSTMSILSQLAEGTGDDLHIYGRSSVKKHLASVGIEPGEFTISVDGTEKKYFLGNDGQVFSEKRALGIVNMYNNNNWINGKNSAGDQIMVFGKNYTIGTDGHINVPTEDFFENENCNYGNVN